MKEAFQKFFLKNNNKFLDFDGYYGPQCVDLVQYWSKEIGGPRFWGDAKDIYDQAGTFFTQVPNTPTAVPKVGDIVVWAGSYNGGPGHVGISNGIGDVNKFEAFEQNDPTGSNSHLKSYNYNKVMGWLSPKGDDCEKKLAESLEEVIKLTGELDQLKEKYDKTLESNALEVSGKNQQIESLQKTNSELTAQITLMVKQVDDAISAKNVSERQVEGSGAKIKELTAANESLAKQILKLEEESEEEVGKILEDRKYDVDLLKAYFGIYKYIKGVE